MNIQEHIITYIYKNRWSKVNHDELPKEVITISKEVPKPLCLTSDTKDTEEIP